MNAPAGLRRVFEPIDIGAVHIPNRIVRTAHLTKLGSDGMVSDDLIGYHLARARGGVGLSFLEATAVHPSSTLSLIGYDDAVIPGYRKLMDAVRPHGMRMFQQLWHAGNIYPGPNGEPARGVSDLPGPLTGLPVVPIATDEISEFVTGYAETARRSAEGGIDGLEIAAGHGYLIYQFLSPATNTRTDQYGGSLENRMRFLVEVLTAVRDAVSGQIPVGVRLGAGQAAGDLDEATVADVTRRLIAAGLVDFVNATMGNYYGMHWMMGAMDRPAGYMLNSSASITAAAATAIPRIVTGRFRTLEEAEEVLRSGTADLVSMVRAHIADPDIIRKARTGREFEVRPCIGCNQGCIARTSGVDLRLGCTVNPAIGRESTLADDVIGTTSHPRDVVVVGGGPAGLEAARVARLRGHRVVLYEAYDQLGGALNLARRAPRVQGLDDILDWYRTEMKRLGVDYRVSAPVDADDVAATHPDVVIVATGADPTMDGRLVGAPGHTVEGMAAAVKAGSVVSSVDLLSVEAPPAGSHILVFDDIGQYEAVSVVDYLLDKGVRVTAATRLPSFGPLADAALRITPALERFYSHPTDFEMLTRVSPTSVDAGKVTLGSLVAAPDTTLDVDRIVLVSYKQSRRDLAEELRGRIADVRLVGDARAARDLQVAIREGNRAARTID